MTSEDFLDIVLKPDKRSVRFKANSLYNANQEIKQFIDCFYPGKSVIEVAYILSNGIKETPRCRTCGKVLEFHDFKHGYRIYCCKSCAARDKDPIQAVPDRVIDRQEVIDTFCSEDGKLIEQRCLTSYLKKNGWFKPLMEFYGDSDSCEETIYRIVHVIDEKPRCKTCGKPLKFKHGFLTFCSAKCASSDEEVKVKNKQSVSEALKEAYAKHGDEIKEKRKKTLAERYKFETQSSSPFGIPEIRELAYANALRRGNAETSIENIMKGILDQIGLEYVRYDRKQISPYELDFYVPDYKIGIECNGVYWHSGFENGQKMLKKSKLCKQKGIKLFHFWEFDIIDKAEVIRDIIEKEIGRYQKIKYEECEVQMLTEDQIKKFINDNSLVGNYLYDKGYGIVYKGEILCCINVNQDEVKIFNKIGIVVTGLEKFFEKYVRKVRVIMKVSNDADNSQLFEMFKFAYSEEPKKHKVARYEFYDTGMNVYEMLVLR